MKRVHAHVGGGCEWNVEGNQALAAGAEQHRQSQVHPITRNVRVRDDDDVASWKEHPPRGRVALLEQSKNG